MSYTPRSDFQPLVPEYWTPFLQEPLYKSLVATEVANTRLKAYLQDGDTVNHSYIEMPDVMDYNPEIGNDDITDSDYHESDATKEFLKVDQVKIAPFYVDRIEELQTNIDKVAEIGDRAGYKLKDTIDKHVLMNVLDGAEYIYTDPLEQDKVRDFLASTRKELRKANVEETGDWIIIASPDFFYLLDMEFSEKGFDIADATLRNGHVGNAMGFNLYMSNNLPETLRLTSAGATELNGEVTGTPYSSGNIISREEYEDLVSDDSSHYDKEGHAIYVGRNKMIDLVMQASPQMDISKAEDRLGYKFKPYTVFGSKVFHENGKRFLNAMVVMD